MASLDTTITVLKKPIMIPVDQSILTQVTRDVCETMLDAPLSDITAESNTGPRWVAVVRITGELNLIVEIETVREVAQSLASRMFSIAPENISELELSDALGEVVNMVGGNVKGILCGEFDLSIPRVEERGTSDAANHDIAICAPLSYGGLPFIVKLIVV